MTLSVGHQNSVEQLVETFDGIDEKLKTLEKVKTLENSNDIPAMRKYLTGEGRTQYDILMRCTEVRIDGNNRLNFRCNNITFFDSGDRYNVGRNGKEETGTCKWHPEKSGGVGRFDCTRATGFEW